MIFRFVYYILKIINTPFNFIWSSLFQLDLPIRDKVVIIGTIGGSGKTTLAQKFTKHGLYHVKLDNCKFGENWKRYTSEEYNEKVDQYLKQSNGKYVIDGIYSDKELEQQQIKNDELIEQSDMVVWNNIPKYIALYRKSIRSIKRYVGVAPQGTAPEKWNNVKEMIKKGWNTFKERDKIINEMWNKNKDNTDKFKCANWPYYYNIR